MKSRLQKFDCHLVLYQPTSLALPHILDVPSPPPAAKPHTLAYTTTPASRILSSISPLTVHAASSFRFLLDKEPETSRSQQHSGARTPAAREPPPRPRDHKFAPSRSHLPRKLHEKISQKNHVILQDRPGMAGSVHSAHPSEPYNRASVPFYAVSHTPKLFG